MPTQPPARQHRDVTTSTCIPVATYFRLSHCLTMSRMESRRILLSLLITALQCRAISSFAFVNNLNKPNSLLRKSRTPYLLPKDEFGLDVSSLTSKVELSSLIRKVTKESTQEREAAPSLNSSSSLSVVPTARRPSVESGLRYRSDDWLRNFLSIPNSFVLRRIRFHWASNTLLCAIFVVLHKLYPNNRVFKLPTIAHSLLGGFMSLLLVFRTNSAYARFWEARGVWTKCMSTCRSMTLNVVNYLQHTAPKSSSRLLQLLQDFPDALCYTCLSGRMDNPVSPNVMPPPNGNGSDDSSEFALEPALMLCHAMHGAVHDASIEYPKSRSDLIEAQHLTEISHQVNSLVSIVSSCEKIVKTPVPWSYSRHTSRFLTLWCGTLPLSLVKPMGSLATLLVVASACWCLFGIEEIGHLIEQPFIGDYLESEGSENPARTQPFDIGIPVCNIAKDVKDEVKSIIRYASADGKHKKT